MNPFLTVLAALLVPILWGLFSAWAFDRWRVWRKNKTECEQAGSGDKAR